MKIKQKLLLSYLLIAALFIAAGATITMNTVKMTELQSKVQKAVEINNNAYEYQKGLDQIQFGTLVYSSDNTQEGQNIMVASAETMASAQTYLLTALANDAQLLTEFNGVIVEKNTIDSAITQVYQIYTGSYNSTDKYVLIWDQLSILMNATSRADLKLASVRNATLTNAQNATTESQNYANFSTLLAVTFLVTIGAISVALSVIMGNRITGPLKKLTDIAHKVSLGDLNQRYYLKEKSDSKAGDEIDELNRAFKRMINAFRMTESLIKETEETDKQ